jgi:hypothetical protein
VSQILLGLLLNVLNIVSSGFFSNGDQRFHMKEIFAKTKNCSIWSWVQVLRFSISWVNGFMFHGTCWFQVQGGVGFRLLFGMVLRDGSRPISGIKVCRRNTEK